MSEDVKNDDVIVEKVKVPEEVKPLTPEEVKRQLNELTLQHAQRGIQTSNTSSGGPIQKR